MNLRLYLLIICLVIVSTKHMSAQVTMGSNNPPEDYAILQLDGEGGLRLPKLTLSERATLQASLDANAKGLVIYLEDGINSSFQYWDGSQWVSLKNVVQINNARNGITDSRSDLGNDKIKQKFELGGTLIEDTKIEQPQAKLLSFNPTGTGSFSVMHNAIVSTESKVGIGREPKVSLLEVEGPAGQAFRYKTPDAKADYILIADTLGNATWRDITPKADLKPGTINNVSISFTGTANAQDESTNLKEITVPLELTPGVWLIMARYIAEATGVTGSLWGYNAWLALRDKAKPSVDISCVGEVPQLMGTTAMSTPQLIYILNVKTKSTYSLYGGVKCNNATNYNMRIIPGNPATIGSSYFNAIRLSEDPSN